MNRSTAIYHNYLTPDTEKKKSLFLIVLGLHGWTSDRHHCFHPQNFPLPLFSPSRIELNSKSIFHPLLSHLMTRKIPSFFFPFFLFLLLFFSPLVSIYFLLIQLTKQNFLFLFFFFSVEGDKERGNGYPALKHFFFLRFVIDLRNGQNLTVNRNDSDRNENSGKQEMELLIESR